MIIKGLMVAVLLWGGVLSTQAADTVRVCAYNVLRFTADNEDGRVSQYRMILEEIRPDLLVCVEVADASMGPRFVTDVLSWAPFAATPYIAGPDMNAQLFYDQEQFDFVGQRRIPTELRDIAEFTLVTRPDAGFEADTVVVYGLHLKASNSQSNAERRAREIAAMMQTMSSASYVIIGGDMNVYSPSEPAYQQVVGPSAVRQFVDPLGTVWQRNSTTYAGLYTQCTRSENIPGCGGGVNGGMDDRFDFLFVSQQLESRTLTETYTAFGNDGTARLNQSINDPPNTVVSAEMADALHCASDHIPVYVDVVLGDVQASVDDERPIVDIGLRGSTLHLTSCRPGQEITLFDLTGRTVYQTVASSTTMQVDVSRLQQGLYLVRHATTTQRIALLR